jgi:hypothetical protein
MVHSGVSHQFVHAGDFHSAVRPIGFNNVEHIMGRDEATANIIIAEAPAFGVRLTEFCFAFIC